MSSVNAYIVDAARNAYGAMSPPVSLDVLAARGDPAELNAFIVERPDQADALKTALAKTNASALFYLEQTNSTSSMNSEASSENGTEASPRTARFALIDNLDPGAMTQVGDVVVTGTKKPKLGLDDVPGGGGGGGGSGGISPGGGSGPPTPPAEQLPPGWKPVGDRGHYMENEKGEYALTPSYRERLEQGWDIDVGGVIADLVLIGGAAFGWVTASGTALTVTGLGWVADIYKDLFSQDAREKFEAKTER